MPIIQNQLNTDNSPWYKIMEERAIVWNEFARANNLETEGFYNANIVTFEIKTHKLNLFGIRQNSNTGAILVGMNHISEELNITIISPINSSKNYIRIRKRGFLNLFRKQLKNRIRHNNYNITCQEETIFNDLKKLGILSFKKIKKLTINKKGVKLVLFELPHDTSVIESFIKYCNNLA
ncbi:hypothetical protein N9K26_00745 [Flavobacteriales bacterium]|nr:hypothetical protein [Flavobacteriales bacterium]